MINVLLMKMQNFYGTEQNEFWQLVCQRYPNCEVSTTA